MRFTDLLNQLDPVACHLLELAHQWQAERNAVPGGDTVDLVEAVGTIERLLGLKLAALTTKAGALEGRIP